MALTNGAQPAPGGAQGGRPGQQVVELTQQEVAQLGELRAMGFTQDQCVRAYIMADRNVEMAASLLFSQNAFQGGPANANPAPAPAPAQGGPAAPPPAADEAQASEAMETEEQNGDESNNNGANPDQNNNSGQAP